MQKHCTQLYCYCSFSVYNAAKQNKKEWYIYIYIFTFCHATNIHSLIFKEPSSVKRQNCLIQIHFCRISKLIVSDNYDFDVHKQRQFLLFMTLTDSQHIAHVYVFVMTDSLYYISIWRCPMSHKLYSV